MLGCGLLFMIFERTWHFSTAVLKLIMDAPLGIWGIHLLLREDGLSLGSCWKMSRGGRKARKWPGSRMLKRFPLGERQAAPKSQTEAICGFWDLQGKAFFFYCLLVLPRGTGLALWLAAVTGFWVLSQPGCQELLCPLLPLPSACHLPCYTPASTHRASIQTKSNSFVGRASKIQNTLMVRGMKKSNLRTAGSVRLLPHCRGGSGTSLHSKIAWQHLNSQMPLCICDRGSPLSQEMSL